jgi:hypothetical protein
MTTPHRATTEEWKAIELASVPREIAPGVTMHHAITVVAAGLVDIRSRVEELEQLHQAVVDLNERFSLEPLVARIEALEAAQQLATTVESSAVQDDDPPTLHAIALRMVDTLEQLGVLPEILSTLRRAIRQPMQQPVSIDLDENDRRFRAVLAAIDNATPEQLRHAAPADNSRDTTEMVGPATDAELEAKPTTKAATESAVAPARIIADRYQLGDSIRRAWLTHGQDSWCVIADCVIAELGAEPTARTATEPALPQSGGRVRDGVSWSEREGDEQFIQPAGPAQYQAAQRAMRLERDAMAGWDQPLPPAGPTRYQAGQAAHTAQAALDAFNAVAERIEVHEAYGGALAAAFYAVAPNLIHDRQHLAAIAFELEKK